MLVRRSLARGSAISVAEVICPGGPRHPGAEEEAPRVSIALPRTGVFVRWHGRRSAVADPTHALLFRAGEAYRVSHPTAHGDVCTVLELDPALADELLGPAPPPQVPTRTADDVAHLALLSRLRAGAATRLGAEEEALAMAGRLAFARPPSDPPRTTAARRRLAERARELLAAHAHEDLSVADLARAAGCSPFHLCRVFREVTGTTLRRHQRRLRVRAALERLGQGERDLTTLAVELGFYDHSHFTNSFRAETGTTPRQLRTLLTR